VKGGSNAPTAATTKAADITSNLPAALSVKDAQGEWRDHPRGVVKQ
jgi:hypothetical protein